MNMTGTRVDAYMNSTKLFSDSYTTPPAPGSWCLAYLLMDYRYLYL